MEAINQQIFLRIHQLAGNWFVDALNCFIAVGAPYILAVRKGKCRQCGTCCNLLFTCPMLARGGLCLVYGKCRPQVCKVFPIDPRDIDEVAACGSQCGYHF